MFPPPTDNIGIIVQSLSHVCLFCDPVDCTQSARFLCPWNLPGKNTRVGCHFLLQGIFPIQGLNLCLLNWQEDSLPLSQQGSTILELVVSFSTLGVVVNIPLQGIFMLCIKFVLCLLPQQTTGFLRWQTMDLVLIIYFVTSTVLHLE